MVKRVSEIPQKGDTLADRLNYSVRGNQWLSGRGHGRLTSHRRGSNKRGSKMKKGMTAYVRDLVLMWRSANREFNLEFPIDHNHSSDLANVIARNMQFFDCSIIFDYVFDNVEEMYPDEEVPPSIDAVLPADNVGLYVDSPEINYELFFYCIPVLGGADPKDEEYYRRHYNIYSVAEFDRVNFIVGEQMLVPHHVGQVCVALNGDCVFDHGLEYIKMSEEEQAVMDRGMRIVCGMLQTINTPRLVVPTRQKVHQFHKDKLKKSLGNFIPDAWNIVTWNVDEPVKSKEHEEGTGARLPLHFRRGYSRKAEKHWTAAYWSTIRNRYEQYIHGYEAGHPAFGVKKNYHLPRKDV